MGKTVSDGSPGSHEVDKEERDKQELVVATLVTVYRICKWARSLKDQVTDPRDPKRITYAPNVLVFTVILMFLFRLGARRQIGEMLRNAYTRQKYGVLFGLPKVPHGDTINDTFSMSAPEEYQELICGTVEGLIRQKIFYPIRLFGRYYLVAIDGTGLQAYSERHCEHCLTQTVNGKTSYFHNVLEAKLVSAEGLAISIMSEFIENPSTNMSKQDCELKAFYRLIARLKERFPHLPICLLLDGLYAGGPTFGHCVRYRWKFIITLKDGSLPLVNNEFKILSQMTLENTLSWRTGAAGQIRQEFRWINDIPHQDKDGVVHDVSVLECLDTRPGKKGLQQTTTFRWVTNFKVSKDNVTALANKGGRIRWKIENEGFNVQKNGGFALEHAYTKNENAAKILYYLLQLAHMIAQFIERGGALRNIFPRGHPTGKNLAFRLLEAWRNALLTEENHRRLLGRYQIRLFFI